jgi:cyclophilin family peptidyl-prolyl cis-trans isomerase
MAKQRERDDKASANAGERGIPGDPRSPEAMPKKSRATVWRNAAIAVSIPALGFLLWVVKEMRPPASARPRASESQGTAGQATDNDDPLINPHGKAHGKATDALGGSLLEQVSPAGKGSESDEPSGAVPTNEQLEKEFKVVTESQQRLNDIKAQAARAMIAQSKGAAQKGTEEGKQLVALLNLRLPALEKDLTAARRARPQDPTVQWLTGELLLIVGGEPDEIKPYFEKAASAGLKRSQLFASLAKVEYDANEFRSAYNHASQALDLDSTSRAAWETYMRTSFGLERFGSVTERLDKAFPNIKPPWAGVIRRSATDMQQQWGRELALRQADEKAGNLPLVQFTIEHKVFENSADGKQQPTVKTTGKGQVTIELFENQAPVSVANFLTLTEQKFYDGTRFHWADAGRMVVGGDPLTKNDNPEDDGTGGPGYAIPDESRRAGAREHFRGCVGVVQNGPKTAGSQFYITLVPLPEFNGHFTCFGRVIKGQEVIDQITEGRTNRETGQFGRIIPGDVLLKAEVIRKRPHKYEVTKLTPAR